MPVEFHRDPDDDDIPVTVDDVTVPGIYEATEKGAGITEEYKAEREGESGGQDTVDEPPAAKITVRGYVDDATWEELKALREREEPFPVSIGPFAFEQMGVVKIEREVLADETKANHLMLELQQFRSQQVQATNIFQRGSGNYTGGAVGDVQGPTAAWTDKNGDGIDDNTRKPLPDMQREPVPANGYERFNVGSGQAFGRLLIDAAASGARYRVQVNGSGWALQDVGARGKLSDSSNTCGVSIVNQGGTGFVQNLYLGDGAIPYSGKRGATGVFVSPSSSGRVTFRYCNVQNWPDNGFRTSPPRTSCEIVMRDCYTANNGHANVRMSYGRIENTVSVIDQMRSGFRGRRCIWAEQPGPVDLANCELALIGGGGYVIEATYNGNPSTVNATNCGISGPTHTGGGVIRRTNTRAPQLNNYADEIPGSAVDAAVGIAEPGTSGGTLQ